MHRISPEIRAVIDVVLGAVHSNGRSITKKKKWLGSRRMRSATAPVNALRHDEKAKEH